MNVDIHGAPIYFEIPILGGIKITASLVVTWGVMLVLTLVCIFLTHGMKVNNISKRQAIAEKIVLTAENFVRSNMGEAWMEWTPFISAIFALSIFSSLASLIGLWSPTADVSTTLAWALVVFVIMTYFKLKTNGLGGYLKGFCDPIFLMAPFNVLGVHADLDGVPSLRQHRLRLGHHGAGLRGAHRGEPGAVRHHSGHHRQMARRDPVPDGRRTGGHLAVFRLVRQLYAGVYLLHADDDVHFHGHRLRPAKHMTTAADAA